MRLQYRLWMIWSLLVLAAVLSGGTAWAESSPVVRMVFFTSATCPHCQTVVESVLTPLQTEYGNRLAIKVVDIDDPDAPNGLDVVNYEMMIRAEEMFDVPSDEQGIPMLIVGGKVLIGEDEITQEGLRCLLDTCLAAEGTSWPDIPGLEEVPVGLDEQQASGFPFGGPVIGGTVCAPEEPDVCKAPEVVIYAAYFYEVGCPECSRAKYHIRYVEDEYPQLVVEEFNVYDDVGLAQCLARQVGREGELHTPALFIGDDALIGQAEITQENLEALVQKYATTGAGRVWEACDAGAAVPPQRPPTVALVLAGLLDGLNPCAFATLIFFVSYLTASERRGGEILAVGAAFAVGVFVTYLAVGLGFYKVLDSVRGEYAVVSRWAYILTALLCGVLAVFSFLDYVKARRGRIEDMALVMPEGLRQRVRTVIRRFSSARAFVPIALLTGAVVSLLELACTGQIYWPVLVSLAGAPESRLEALPLLLVYNLMFVLPLVVVFVLVYCGTTSLQLGLFLRRHTATVKLGTALLFAALAAWLTFSFILI